ncbi:MAG TPA: hypothetical protein VJ302_29145 [Blastocatellia bacterium]|nr:hypothetical protein [Blastocatellia bacterium]
MMNYSQEWIGVRLSICLILLASAHLASCSKAGPPDEVAFTIPERLKLKSSTAQASRIIAELKSGDRITISRRANADDGTPWVKILGPAGEAGWAEARNFVKLDVVDQSRRLAEKVKDVQTQAIGRSKAALRLRLTPDRATEDNVAILVPSGTALEIVGREHKPRPALHTGDDESEPAGKKSESAKKPKEKAPEIKYDDWLLVRIKDNAVLPAGWIYGGSVILEIPSEIIYYNSDGRRITGWQKISAAGSEDNNSGDSFLVLERRLFDAEEQFDFDRVKVLAYDSAQQVYVTTFQKDLAGRLPVTLKMDGTRGQLQMNVFDKELRPQEVNYRIEIQDGGRIAVAEIDPRQPEKRSLTRKR